MRRRDHAREWSARKARLAARVAEMIRQLGAYCGAGCDPELGCGATDGLQLHHKTGKPWRSREVGPLRRLRLTEVDFARGDLGVLCSRCNATDGGVKTPFYRARKVEVPF